MKKGKRKKNKTKLVSLFIEWRKVFFNSRLVDARIEREQGRIHDCSCRGRLGRGSIDLGRGSNDLGRGMLKYKLFNP